MKKSHNDGVNKEIARLKAIRLILVGVGVILSVAVIVAFTLYNPLLVTGSEADTLPQNQIGQPQKSQPVESETEATEQMTQTSPTESHEEENSTETEEVQEKEHTEESTESMTEESTESMTEDKSSEEGKTSDTDPPDQNQSEENAADSKQLTQSVSLEPANKKSETEPATVVVAETPENTADMNQSTYVKGIFLVLCVLLGADVAAIIVVSILISARSKSVKAEQNMQSDDQWAKNIGLNQEDHSIIQVAGLHNIGARPYQEDSLGADVLQDGVLAVVADGMGGLSGGDRVSQKIVYTMLEYGKKLSPGQMDGALEAMVNGVNQEVNRMLGTDGLYKSGSTLLAALVRGGRFHWITVGDSRIYYYHNRQLIQLNQEHNVGQDLLIKATRGELSFEEARNAPKKGRVTSFIGMGNLKYVDKSYRSIELAAGDRILLMTDGVFNTLSDQTILSVLENCPDIQMAATKLEQLVVQVGHPKQDNFTAIILGR